MKMKSSVIVVAGAFVALAACSQRQIDSTQHDLASAAPHVASDGVIYARIEAKFVQIDADSSLHVAVASHDGAVRLSGKVKSDDIERKYVAAAKAIDGVTHVNATMTVDTKLPSSAKAAADFTTAAAVRVAIASQAGVNAIALHIDVKSGVVTLRGTVPTAALHQTIVAAAKGAHGVSSVVDDLHDGS